MTLPAGPTARYLVVDIGGTHVRLAIAQPAVDGLGFALTRLTVLDCKDFASFDDVLAAYQRRFGGLPRRGCIAVAGPVNAGQVTMTNLDWTISTQALCADFGFERLELVNDLVATACSLVALSPGETSRIKKGLADLDAPRAVIGVGTGLGVAALIRCDDGWRPIASEGGHVALGDSTRRAEQRWRQILRHHEGHLSAEAVIGAPGLRRLYRALAEAGSRQPDDLRPRQITQRARDGDPLCAETVAVYRDLLADFAGDIALTYGARGGVYLAGEALRYMEKDLAGDAFRERFCAKGPMRELLREIPVRLILHEHPGLPGAAAWISSLSPAGGESDARGTRTAANRNPDRIA